MTCCKPGEVKMKKMLMCAAACCCAAVWADTSFTAGEWKVDFVRDSAMLTLTHEASGACLIGPLAFAGPQRAVDAAAAPTNLWTVSDSRDGVPNRLAIIDPNNDAQGYITFQSNGSRLSFLVYHRTALAYQGGLLYAGHATYREDAFACRTRATTDERVLSLQSGDAASLLDDSLFSPAKDEALQFDAGVFTIAADDAGGWNFSMSGSITEHSESSFSFNVERHYYRNRWVPYYSPIDRSRCPRPPTGWMSWNIYFDQAGSKENLAEADLGAKYLKPFGLEIWSIESWQDNSPKLPVSNFYNMNLEHYATQFPEGMKWLADEIRKRGFRPGLWMAPFGTGNREFYEAHKDWFLHGKDGRPLGCWNGKYTLDPTAKGALEHLRGIFDKASHEWGYEFFKIDGMSGRGAGYCAHMYERPDVRARFQDPTVPNPFERCCKAFREGIGRDRIFLACQGHFTGAEAGYCDASRTGADIVHPNQPVKWANLMLQARCTINQNFANGIVFWGDPDCMMISDKALADEQARVETTIVALPGQQMFAGDKLGELAPSRIKMLQQALPVADVKPAALYPMFGHLPVWDLNVSRPFGDWHVVALFNWADYPQSVGFNWNEIGEADARQFACWEFWTSTWQGVNAGGFSMRLPPRSVRLVAMQPLEARPQFLSSDRHITQGAVEWKGDKWDDGAKKLVSTVTAVGGFPLTVRFALPDGFAPKSVSVPSGVKNSHAIEAGGKVMSVTVEAAASGDVPVEIVF